MIVRIINNKADSDKFWECFSASIVKTGEAANEPVEYSLYIESQQLGSVTIQLSQGDQVYYMNNEGKTINSDMRMCCE